MLSELWVHSSVGLPAERKPVIYLADHICPHCDEGFAAGDRATLILGFPPAYWHAECLMRTIAGSVGHQSKRCSCYGGTEEDPPGLSRREAARAAFEYWKSVTRRNG